jgi:hypothetical protein
MKILIADKLSPKAIAALEKIGADITSNPELKAEDLGGETVDDATPVGDTGKIGKKKK